MRNHFILRWVEISDLAVEDVVVAAGSLHIMSNQISDAGQRTLTYIPSRDKITVDFLRLLVEVVDVVASTDSMVQPQ